MLWVPSHDSQNRSPGIQVGGGGMTHLAWTQGLPLGGFRPEPGKSPWLLDPELARAAEEHGEGAAGEVK